jgi:hypothetical protein
MLIETLSTQLNAAIDASNATPGLKDNRDHLHRRALRPPHRNAGLRRCLNDRRLHRQGRSVLNLVTLEGTPWAGSVLRAPPASPAPPRLDTAYFRRHIVPLDNREQEFPMTSQEPTPEEWPLIRDLHSKLTAILDQSGLTPAGQAFAAIKIAGRYAGRARMPPEIANAMLTGYVVRGEPD